MSRYLTELPPQTIRDAIIETLESFNSALNIHEMERFVSEELELSQSMHTAEEMSYFHNILDDMRFGGKIEIKNKMVYIGLQDKPQFKKYNPETIKYSSNNILDKKGSKVLYTIGSQYYPKPWSSLQEGETVKVILVAEKNNPYDSNAIAVTINETILGHFTRSDAREYSKVISDLDESSFMLTVEGLVMARKDETNYKYLKLYMPSIEDLTI
jgi:hypothetical protein